MILWIDAHLSPQLTPWISQTFPIQLQSLVSLGLRDANDLDLFDAARTAGATIMSKDQDFVDLALMHDAPPKIIWVTCGNTSNVFLHNLLQRVFPKILRLLESGEPLVELPGKFQL